MVEIGEKKIEYNVIEFNEDQTSFYSRQFSPRITFINYLNLHILCTRM